MAARIAACVVCPFKTEPSATRSLPARLLSERERAAEGGNKDLDTETDTEAIIIEPSKGIRKEIKRRRGKSRGTERAASPAQVSRRRKRPRRRGIIIVELWQPLRRLLVNVCAPAEPQSYGYKAETEPL